MKLPQETIQQILQATDIVKLIGREVDLKRMDDHYEGRCPFHGGTEADFHVYPQRQLFKCNRCGIGGGPVRFLAERHMVSPVEAMRQLAELAGIEIPGHPQRVWHISLKVGASTFISAMWEGERGTPLSASPEGHFSIFWLESLQGGHFQVAPEDEQQRQQVLELLRFLLARLERSTGPQ